MVDTVTDLDRRQMYAEIRKLCTPNNFTNWWVLIREYAVFAATVAGCLGCHQYVTEQGWSIAWMAPVYLLAVFIIGAWVQNRLGVLIHESSHYALFKTRVLNDIMANLFVVFPFFGNISNYRIGHWGHHRHVNNPEKDPDLHRLVKHHPRNFPIPKWKFMFEYVAYQLLLHKAVSYIKGRAEYVAFAMKSEPVKNHDALGKWNVMLMRIVYYGLWIAVLSYMGWWLYYLLFWIVPFLTFYPAVLFLREIAHHGNYPDDGDFTNSRVYLGRWLEREIFFSFGEHNHVLHHMFPTIPHHKMRRAHATMMRYPPYRDQVVICNGFFIKADRSSDLPTVLDVLAAPSGAYNRSSFSAEARGEIRETTVQEVGG